MKRRLIAEFVGTLLLLATVVGSGVMGVHLVQGNDGIALLANAAATAGMLYVLITIFGSISGAHFNPVVTLAMRLQGELDTSAAIYYTLAQFIGGIAGVMLAHLMFALPLIQASAHARYGWGQWVSESVATFGLLLTILLGRQHCVRTLPALVASYIFAAYWFTASTSFANPAVTVARALTQTFVGIRLADVLGFIIFQLLGALLALIALRLLRDQS